jgi:hypothetical protein
MNRLFIIIISLLFLLGCDFFEDDDGGTDGGVGTTTQPIGNYEFGVSDEPGYAGKFYFIKGGGPYQSLTIGGQPYQQSGTYQGRSLWYGTGQGAIVLVATNGTTYVGTTGQVENPTPTPTGSYETYYHHTTTASSDGGKSLVLCPGDDRRFDRCTAGGVTIPFHGYDTGRVIYWNMFAEPKGDIVCTKGGKTYRYPAERKVQFGRCR